MLFLSRRCASDSCLQWKLSSCWYCPVYLSLLPPLSPLLLIFLVRMISHHFSHLLSSHPSLLMLSSEVNISSCIHTPPLFYPKLISHPPFPLPLHFVKWVLSLYFSIFHLLSAPLFFSQSPTIPPFSFPIAHLPVMFPFLLYPPSSFLFLSSISHFSPHFYISTSRYACVIVAPGHHLTQSPIGYSPCAPPGMKTMIGLFIWERER